MANAALSANNINMCILNEVWFEELLEDLLKFEKENTKKYDLTMAFFQVLIGIFKLMDKKTRTGNKIVAAALQHVLNG
jgi:hypothetical protein